MAYTRLLRVYYRTEKPILVGEQYRLCRASTPDQKKAVDLVLAEFFKKRRNSFINSRAETEIAAYKARAELNQIVGRLGGRPRRNPNETQTVSKNNPSQIPDTKNHKPEKNKKGTPLPGDFQISERVKSWAEEKGLVDLESDLEFFIGRMKANGKTYVDWDEAFMNCVREDWAGLRKAKQ